MANYIILYIIHCCRKCPEVLDGNDKNKWEDIILAFLRAKQVKVIILCYLCIVHLQCVQLSHKGIHEQSSLVPLLLV